MNARKRPAEPRSRGHSPVEKRARPHQAASPPRSRTGSRAGLPENAPTGPARKTTESNADVAVKRATNNVSKFHDDRRGSLGYSPLNVQSPRSGSGASTPLHAAPTVPSMLPKAGSDAPRTTMAALLRARQTRQAILDGSNAQRGNADPTLLKAQEVQYLQLSEKTKAFETTIQHLLGRVVELEKKADLAGKDSTEHVPKAEIDDVIKAFVLKEISTQIEQARQEIRQQVISAETKLNDKIEKEKENIKSLSSGFNTLADYKASSAQEIPEPFQNLIDMTNKIREQATVQSRKVEDEISALSEKINEVQSNETKTYNKASNNADSIEDLNEDMKDLKRDISKLSLTREDIDRFRKDVTDLKLVVGQVKNFQSELGKLTAGHKRLTSGQDTISVESKALKIRLDVLEKSSNNLATNSGSPVTKSSTEPGQADAQAAAQSKRFSDDITELQKSSKESQAGAAVASERMELFSNDIKGLQASAKANEVPVALVTQIDERLKSLEQLPEKFVALRTSHIDQRHIDKRLNSLDQLPQKVHALNKQTTKLNQDITALADRVTKLDQTATESQTSQRRPNHSQEQRLYRLQQEHPDASAVALCEKEISDLWEVVEDFQKKEQEQDIIIDVLQNVVPNMLTKSFDPFQAQVRQDRELTNTKLDALVQEVLALQQSSRASEETKVASEEIRIAIEGLKQEIMPLQNVMTNTAQCAQEISSLRQQLLEKADANTMDEHMNNFRHSFRVLQDQYNNLTTDELHGKMVHWILQHYPTSTATMQQQYASLLQDVRDVHELYAQLSWIPPKKPDLVALLENGLQRGHIFADEALESASQAMMKVGAIEATLRDNSSAIQSLQRALTGVQQSLQNLNTASFIRASVVDEAKKTIEALSDRFTQLDGASSTLRQEHDALMQDFIEPNRETFGMFGQMLALVGQIQVFTESVYMNIPTKDGTSLLPRPAWLASENGENGNGMHKGKGKGKQ
jgi:DNA repair exonuclease SbcCD ATPase subunit